MKFLGTIAAALFLVGGALLLSAPGASAQPLLPCDPVAPVFPCTTGDFPGGNYCLHFAFGAACFTQPAPQPEEQPAPAAPDGPPSGVIGDPQPWTDETAPFPPTPFGPGGEG